MVSDCEIVKRLEEVLKNSDLNTTTANTIRRGLEQHFGIDLSDRKRFIREQIDSFLHTHKHNYEIAQQEEVHVKQEQQEVNVKQEQQEVNVKQEQEQEEEEEDYEEDPEEEEYEQVEIDDVKIIKKESVEEVNKIVKRRGGGFTKICALSPILQKFVGVPEMARTEVVQKIWAYIRENNLQNPKDKRIILCDETLHAIFGVKSIGMFKMNKVLAKHIWPIEESAAAVKSSQKKSQNKRSKDEDSKEPKNEAKRQKGGGSGFLTPLPLSDALVNFLGTGENALSRADVVKRMWEYIKQNNLQDPSDKRIIICDDKLKELFEVDTFIGFTVSKLLTAHFIKRE